MPHRLKIPKTPRPKLSEIGCLDNICPHCEQTLEKRPERKAACPLCGNAIYVRSRPFDRQRVLLTEQQASQIEAEWSNFQTWSKRSKSSR
jgi:DNA-directed RNA polymerase subunit RPC12/RpoP